MIVNVLKFVFCLFAAMVGNFGNSQAVFQNDANTQVGQQFAPPNNYPNGKQQSLQQISSFV